MEASLTSPLLRVSRPVSACSRCRTAKVKCDGKLPACTACEKSGKAHECTGSNDNFARGKERSYIASLEARLERLEKRLAQLDRRRASVAMIDTPAQTPKLTGDGDSVSLPSPLVRRAKKREEEAEMENLVADLGFLQINATTRDFHGDTGKVSFCTLVLKASASSKSLDSKTRARLPSRHTATQLIQHYFDKIFTLMPCFSETSFFGSLDTVYRDEASASAFDCYMVYMVLGVGTMSLSRNRNSPAAHNAACFVKAALEYAPQVISPANLTGVQATLMLVQYSMLEPQHFNSWYLIGVASRIMIDLGLHHEPQKVLKLKPAELDLRRKIFYCVYALDRSISMVLQRPFSFSDDAVDVQLPKVLDITGITPIKLLGTLTSMAAAIHLFKLRKLQSGWYQQLYHTGNEPMPDPKPLYLQRRQALEDWLKSIPESITKANRDWLTLEWHYLYVYVSAPCPKVPQPCQEALTAIFTHCVQYAVMFRRILSDPNNRILYTYHDAVRTYYVGRNLLHVLWHHEADILDQSNIGAAMEGIKATNLVLSAMTVRWQDSEGLREQFRQEAWYMLAILQQKLDEYLASPTLQETNSADASTSVLQIPGLSSMQQQALENRLNYDFTEWPEFNAAVLAINGRTGGMGFNPSAHVTTTDFGNVAFYRYDERNWEDVHGNQGVI